MRNSNKRLQVEQRRPEPPLSPRKEKIEDWKGYERRSCYQNSCHPYCRFENLVLIPWHDTSSFVVGDSRSRWKASAPTATSREEGTSCGHSIMRRTFNHEKENVQGRASYAPAKAARSDCATTSLQYSASSQKRYFWMGGRSMVPAFTVDLSSRILRNQYITRRYRMIVAMMKNATYALYVKA
jgi:hypothetical protein